MIRSHGITSDGAGHLFVADGFNDRILAMNYDGTGMTKLTDTENNVHEIVWIPSHRNLAISSGEDYMVHMYKVNYAFSSGKKPRARAIATTEAKMGPSNPKAARYD